MKYKIPTIYSRLDAMAVKPQHVVMISQKLDTARVREQAEGGRGHMEYLDRKHLRLREDAFVASLHDEGVRTTVVEGATLASIKDFSKVVTTSADVVVIVGEITSQSFSLAAQVAKFLPNLQPFIEFTEENNNPAALRAMVKAAQLTGTDKLMGSLVYLTRVRKTPSSLVIAE